MSSVPRLTCDQPLFVMCGAYHARAPTCQTTRASVRTAPGWRARVSASVLAGEQRVEHRGHRDPLSIAHRGVEPDRELPLRIEGLAPAAVEAELDSRRA